MFRRKNFSLIEIEERNLDVNIATIKSESHKVHVHHSNRNYKLKIENRIRSSKLNKKYDNIASDIAYNFLFIFRIDMNFQRVERISMFSHFDLWIHQNLMAKDFLHGNAINRNAFWKKKILGFFGLYPLTSTSLWKKKSCPRVKWQL